jgi:putative ABC transport system ATP-binding protein
METPTTSPPLIALAGVCKTYGRGEAAVQALRQVDLRVEQGEFVAIMGPSGSGKTTLLNIIGCLDRPTTGSYRLLGEEVRNLSATRLARLRNHLLGFVFQNFALLPRASALDNVQLPLLYAGVARRERVRRAREALDRVGLGTRLHHRPNELSGGQQQRVAIARALVNRPRLILADEPTGNLDSRTSFEIMALFQELGAAGITVAFVTHEPDVAAFASRVVIVRDGRIARDEARTPRLARALVDLETATPVAEERAS